MKIDRYTNPHIAVDYIFSIGAKYAEAKAQRVYLEQFRKSKKALLIQDAPEGTIQAKESYAYAHKDYLDLLEGLKVAVQREAEAYHQLSAANLRVEVWRTECANNRKELNAGSIHA